PRMSLTTTVNLRFICSSAFLHVLNVHTGVAEQHLSLTNVTAQLNDLVGGTERTSQQAVGVQPLQPLTVKAVRLGPAFEPAGFARIDEQHLEPSAFQAFIQR